jgi:hypothetical protein
MHCGTSDTPNWRRGPEGIRTLCNACGLRWVRKASRDLQLQTASYAAVEAAHRSGWQRAPITTIVPMKPSKSKKCKRPTPTDK